MSLFSLKMIPSLISVFVFLLSNIFIFQFDIVEVSAEPEFDEDSAMHYLAKYGYTKIADEKISKQNRVSKDDMTAALKEYQKFYKLNVTGKLDKQTVNEMKQPRCGVPDKFPDHLNRFKPIGSRWNKGRVMFQILNTLKNKNYQVPSSAVESDFSQALSLWQQYIPIQLQLSNHPGFDPDVPVSFLSGRYGNRGESFDGPGGTLASAYSPPPQYGGYTPTMQFDNSEDWYFQNGRYGPRNDRGVSFYQVATHELGHALGLDHSNDINAVMYARHIPKPDSNFRLTSDDIRGIQAVYNRNRNNGDPKIQDLKKVPKTSN